MLSQSSTKYVAAGNRLTCRDVLVLTLVGVLLFGYCTISGKPLTMHEARLPQCAREMLATGEWLLPRSGDRPWLERPPFPHWCELAVGRVMGRLDAVWIVRIPPAMAGLITLLLSAWTAARVFGRRTGLISGLALATMYEFYFYAGQAEDDIFLALLVAACIALFVAAEFPAPEIAPDSRDSFFGNRSWKIWAFFAVLGFSSLAKGPLVGAIEVCAATGAFLFADRENRRAGRYVWLWGWLLAAVLTLAWPFHAAHVYPGFWDNLKYDFNGPFGHESRFYYFVCILWATAPWTPFWMLGLVRAGRRLAGDASRRRFLYCWALAPLVALSIPLRKHHHYLVPVLPAFGVLVSFGLASMWQDLERLRLPRRGQMIGAAGAGLFVLVVFMVLAAKNIIPGGVHVSAMIGLWIAFCIAAGCRGLQKRNGTVALAAFIAGIIGLAAWGQSVPAREDENRTGLVEFLSRAGTKVPAGFTLYIDASGSLDFFRNQFYSSPDAKIVHNLTFLRDDRIHDPRVYVMARYGMRGFLSMMGECTMLDQCRRARREVTPDDRYTLFYLQFKPGLTRYPAPKVSVLQALERGECDQAGPYCGPPPSRSPQGVH